MEPWMSMPCMFAKGPKGIVIPEITPGCEWVYNSDSGIMTVKLDGILVELNLVNGAWQIAKRVTAAGFLDVSRDTEPILYECLDNLEYKSYGFYECYGKDINGNPHRLDKNLMIKVFPVDYTLISYRGGTAIKRGYGTPLRDFYNGIKQELSMSPEIEGLVFHLENTGNSMLLKGATITKKDFGLPWPEPTTVVDVQ